MLFARGNRDRVLGIDIGSASIKVLELSGSGKPSVKAERYGLQVLPSGAVVDGKIKDVDMVIETLQKAIKKSGSKIKRGAACISSSDIISKVIAVQSRLREDDLLNRVEMETDRLIQYDLEEVSIDFLNLGPSVASPEEDDIQIVACRKAIVEEVVDVLESAGIEPAIVDIDIHALARIHSYMKHGLPRGKGKQVSEEDKGLTGIVDFGANATRFMVLQHGQVIFYRDTAFSGKQLIDDIREKYDMSQNEATRTLGKGGLPEDFKGEVLKPFVKTLIQETARLLRFFYSSTTYDSLSELRITGGCSQIGNLETIIGKRLNVPTHLLNPFDSVAIDSRIDKKRLEKEAATLGVACGLALRGVK